MNTINTSKVIDSTNTHYIVTILIWLFVCLWKITWSHNLLIVSNNKTADVCKQ